MRKTANILIIDDDPTIARLIKELLKEEGLEGEICLHSSRAMEAITNSFFDLILCDVMMPEIDGFKLCQEIRSRSKVPIIFITAKRETTTKVSGLVLGADDYITKPFDNHELIARVKSQLRRISWDKEAPSASSPLRIQNLTLDPLHHECCIDKCPIKLAPKEFKLLLILMSDPQTPHSVKELFETVWKEAYDESGGNSVMVHMRRLRKKLANVDSSHNYITTVWGVGYKMQQ